MEIAYRATDRARAIIGALGRTEDVRFSPSNRRLAIAAFEHGTIAVLDVEIARRGGSPSVSLSGGIEISSTDLKYPHGLDFLDDDTLAVANRDGDVVIFRLPLAGAGRCELSPIQVLAAGNGSLLKSPGSVAAVPRGDGLCELLVCNNYGDSVTRHVVDRGAGCAIVASDVLVKKWVNLPDGLGVSRDGRWIAVSNHNTHSVLLYERSSSLNEHTQPHGILRGVCFPHGLRFSADGRHLFVADAGAPFVHVYVQDGEGWHGARSPAASVRIMDEALFLRGRQNPQEGGPKGIDLDAGMNVLVATSERQPLLVLDAEAVLAKVPSTVQVLSVEHEGGILDHAKQLQARLVQAEAGVAAAEARAAAAEARAAHEAERAVKFKAKAKKAKAKAAVTKARAKLLFGRWRWRATAPFGRLYAAFKRPN